ncbi:hypothetical protein LCGC14_1032670 [marine sediment metagenome]|uniref:Uncharacterized protein n=1 Tax=marine sediment metagenome TaxID=412755 RepID=A0A0F9R078_9ZZZZ|nr:MAG: hypothetical protein Lokiarch_01340 [Candidatus Lokiarchaeum sp. GC14_75]
MRINIFKNICPAKIIKDLSNPACFKTIFITPSKIIEKINIVWVSLTKRTMITFLDHFQSNFNEIVTLPTRFFVKVMTIKLQDE